MSNLFELFSVHSCELNLNYYICAMNKEFSEYTKALKSVSSYAKMKDVSTSYIYKMIRENKLKAIEIDKVIFINIKENPPL